MSIEQTGRFNAGNGRNPGGSLGEMMDRFQEDQKKDCRVAGEQ